MTIETIPISKSPENFRIALLPDIETPETYKVIELDRSRTQKSFIDTEKKGYITS